MADNKNKTPKKVKIVDEATGTGTATGGTTSTHASTGHILGFSDTQINSESPFDKKGQEVLTKVSIEQMGNEERKARKGKKRTVYGKFGKESTEKVIKENLSNSEKAPQHTLGNVLGLMSTPKPRGP